MQFTAQQVAFMLQGRIEGDPNVTVSTVAKIEEATKGCLCFVANPKYEEYIYDTQASVVLVNDSFVAEKPVTTTLIRTKDAYSSFALLLEKYQEITSKSGKTGIEQPSFVAPTAKIGNNVYIGAFTYIDDNAVIGDNTHIYPGCFIGRNAAVGENSTIFAGVKIYNECKVGSKVTIHSGTVLGSDGFGFAPQTDGTYKKMPQTGNVVVEDSVEIGANTVIDRATMGSTIIRSGVKMDNLIQIAHNVEIGSHTAIAAQTGVSGSTKVGQYCVIGGQAGLVGHIQIADGTKINAQSGVSKTVTVKNSLLNGTPAFDYKNSLKSQAIFRNLPDLQQRVTKLEETIQELTALLVAQTEASKK